MTSSDRITAFFRRNSQWFFRIYAVMLFSLSVGLLLFLSGQHAFVLQYPADFETASLIYVFAVFIIVLGFQAPGFTHVSLDRITQVGITLILGPADSALLNGAASLTYPFIAAKKNNQPISNTLFSAMHNCGMFVIIIYMSGYAYTRLKGVIPLSEPGLSDIMPCLTLYLCMQIGNETFIRAKMLLLHGSFVRKIDWAVQGVETIGFFVALLTALVINNANAFVSVLFIGFLVMVILIARSINGVSTALVQRINQMTTLNSVAKKVSSSLQLNELYETVYMECSRLLAFNQFYLGVIDRESRSIEYKFSGRSSEKLVVIKEKFQHDLIDWLIKNNTPLFLKSYYSVASEFRAMLSFDGHQSGSFIGIPLCFDDEFLGIIVIQSDFDFAYQDSDFDLMIALSSQVGVAIKNVHLYADLSGLNSVLEQRVEERTRQLERAQRDLVDQARKAGMAEIARNALHNIGNVLNTMNTSAQALSMKIKSNKQISGLSRANGLLRENEGKLGEFLSEGDKGRKLVEYYSLLEQQMSTERAELEEQMMRLMQGIENVSTMVVAQQSYADLGDCSENLALTKIIDEALFLYEAELINEHVEVNLEYVDAPIVEVERSKLVQVVIQLLNNAIEAMRSVTGRKKYIDIKVWNDKDNAYVSIADSGHGVAPTHVSKLFTQGFTTKRNGYGFGLHGCANSLKEMRGNIEFDQSMAGGAKFILSIPISSVSAEVTTEKSA